MEFVEPVFDNERSKGFESDNSEESNGPEWLNWHELEEELDSDDKELIDNGCDKVFCFDSDHAALKGNADYHNLIRTLAILEAQRIKSIEDIKKLETLRKKVRANPREYLNNLLKGDTSDIPSKINIQQVPEIDWSKYSLDSDCKETINQTNDDFSTSTHENENTAKRNKTSFKHEENANKMVVRGRMYDQSKPQTFNQLWTPEEQMRLEELLLEYPPERKESNRWRKIAQALGNRTTKQVCSRVQKYFKKLKKDGLPIPGHHKRSNNLTYVKKKTRKKRKIIPRATTFFPTQHLGAGELLDCEEDQKPKALPFTFKLKTEIINKVIEFKKKDAKVEPFTHPGIKCVACVEMPLRGTRWHCLVCPSVNLCSDCVISQLTAQPPLHSPSHPLQPLSNPTLQHWDPDYMPDSFQSTNYLDPNFITTSVVTMH